MKTKPNEIKGPSRYNSLFVPNLTVFITSFCIMVLELVAGRLTARFLGSSLYTWTSVIGVVLGGITLGNYIGGHIADRFKARKSLAWLFAVSSVGCVVTIILNNLVGNWTWLWNFDWPLRVFTHVCLVFLLPSAFLGAISPVVAKMALERGLPTGKTVGQVYAWGAAGSIAGTFSAGYLLIAQMGSIAIIWTIASVLLLIGILYCIRLWPLYILAAVFTCALVMGIGPWDWAEQTGSALALRRSADENIIYEDETSYCYVAVKKLSSVPDRRTFIQDRLKHSEIIMGDELNLQYFYHHIFAAVTGGLSDAGARLNVLILGGGGYAYPRYVEKAWPGSRIDVAEIDPGVTEAAMNAFGLERDSSIRIFTMDGRNYIDTLLEQNSKNGQKDRYDFLYNDAINNYSIPYHLTTLQFNEKIDQLLTDKGVYMLNLIDVFDSGLLLGSVVNTLEKTFPYVYVVTRGDTSRAAYNTFVVCASKHDLDVKGLCSNYKSKNQNLWYLSQSDMQELSEKSRGLVLTDDYAPVESLLGPVVRAESKEFLAGEYLKEAQELFHQGMLDASVRKYQEIIDIDSTASVMIYNEMGLVLSRLRKWDKACEAFENSLNYISENKLMINTANAHFNLAGVLTKAGKTRQASEQFRLAAEEYRRELLSNPDSAQTHILLARSLSATRNFDEAGDYFLKAVKANPLDVNCHLLLVQNFEVQGKREKATNHLQAAIIFMLRNGQKEAAARLQGYLQQLQPKQ